DWIYNNRYVDRTDQWRHSKWLSFMEKRLRLAKRLLKPDGVLICTIDENEVAHLGVLLEEIFPGYLRHLDTIVHNPKGTSGPNFSVVNEFACFVGPDKGELIEQLPPADDEPESGHAETLFAGARQRRRTASRPSSISCLGRTARSGSQGTPTDPSASASTQSLDGANSAPGSPGDPTTGPTEATTTEARRPAAGRRLRPWRRRRRHALAPPAPGRARLPPRPSGPRGGERRPRPAAIPSPRRRRLRERSRSPAPRRPLRTSGSA